MKYQGGKFRHAGRIIGAGSQHRLNHWSWVEPFVGGGNSIMRVTDSVRIGSDICRIAVQALKAIRDNPGCFTSRRFTEQEYMNADRENPNDRGAIAAFVMSFGGKLWGGFARNKQGRDYLAVACNAIGKQSRLIQNIPFQCIPYTELEIPPYSTIYCDPPYARTTGYKSGDFDKDEFVSWCQARANERHGVFVSEFDFPIGEVILQFERKRDLRKITTGNAPVTEKLYHIKPE
jgi:DNA adenine methylase